MTLTYRVDGPGWCVGNEKRKDDSSVARIAGNIISGDTDWLIGGEKRRWAVMASAGSSPGEPK